MNLKFNSGTNFIQPLIKHLRCRAETKAKNYIKEYKQINTDHDICAG